jgi:NAD(P)H-hydrate epimerase
LRGFPKPAPADGLLLAPGDVARLDRLAVEGGTPGHVLMERAGTAVARTITARYARRPVLVACGPGNNGGDGWVVARLLRAAGWEVEVTSLVPPSSLAGDARAAADGWDASWVPPTELSPVAARLVVDALFGAGLARDVDGAAARLIEQINTGSGPVVAVDIPSGIDGATGSIRGMAVRADVTVTFVRAKPGLVLLPGRIHAGEIVAADIGIEERHLSALGGQMSIDLPCRWRRLLPRRDLLSHKYTMGHALVVGGPAHATGAARMTASTALRIGAGLVTVAVDPDAVAIYAAGQVDLMTVPLPDEEALDRLLADARRNAVAIGPAAGIGERTRDRVRRILAAGKRIVLDADALTSIAPCEQPLGGDAVLTPHQGEFARLFPGLQGARIERAMAAAAQSGAVVILKGADTVVASPDGRATILDLAAPALATAGAGDVLTGAVLGLLAQGMPSFEAAAAAVRLHAEAGAMLSTGLTAADLPSAIGRRLAAHSAAPPFAGPGFGTHGLTGSGFI